jgi:hypothetical protein
MKSPKKNKFHFINEIINIIKKHNISLEEIIKAYIQKYNITFTSEERLIHNIQYQNFIKYAKDDLILNQPNTFLLAKYKIIDDYILI